jgi:hypothetical protein
MTHFPFIKSLLLLPVLALSTQAMAQLKPMDDSALDSTVGQAYIEMDSYLDDASNQISRITFGQTIKLQANADSLTLGDIGGNADIAASNVSFGYIDTATNTIIPFEFSDPYFEWSTNPTTNDLTSFRIGFGEAKGILQMDLTSFSGNIDMLVNGQSSGLFTGNGSAQAANRGSYIGVDGTTCDEGVNCVSLANIQSLDVGDGVNPTSDFFLSFQKTSKNWLKGRGITTDVNGNGVGAYQPTTTGFFMNIPTNNSINITTSGTGTNGLAVEFIDRGVGRWNN